MFFCAGKEKWPSMIILVVIDGIKTEMVPELKLFKWLAGRGSFTTRCRPAYPPLTEPCFAAMLYGVDPVYLGCYWMSSRPWGKYPDYLRGNVDLFTAIRQGKPRSRSTVLGTWPAYGGVVDMKCADDQTRRTRAIDSGVTDEALAAIAARRSDLLMVYYEDPDHVGHESGVGARYRETLERTQAEVIRIVAALDPAQDTLIVTSDHSRDKKEHYSYIETIMQTPLFMWGRGIRPRHRIATAVGSIDIAPTIMRLMGLPIPAVWRGRVIDEVLTGT